MRKARIGGTTVDKLLEAAEAFKGFKKHPSVLRKLDGKYRKEGLGLKKEGRTSADLVRELREAS